MGNLTVETMFVNVFEEDWRACLRAHYAHVIKEHDINNERSLETVLMQTGFSEVDLAAMRSEILAELGWPPEELAQEVEVPDSQEQSIEVVGSSPDEAMEPAVNAEPAQVTPVTEIPAVEIAAPAPIEAAPAAEAPTLESETPPAVADLEQPQPEPTPKGSAPLTPKKKPPEKPKQMSLF